jgi:hypothetical protein
MKLRSPAGLAAGLLSAALLHATPAAAEPVTVDLRIEGATHTLFEGPVTTDVRPFRFTDDATGHRCDGTAATGGASPEPVPTRGAVMAQAAEFAPFAIEGTWHPQFGATFTSIDGESVAFDPVTNRFLAEYENGTFASLGACADGVQAGDDVLFAYADGSETLLSLSGPAKVDPGDTATLRVTDAASGAPVAGATIGGAKTGADGTARVGPLASKPHLDFKAIKPGAIRSNRARICVTDGDCQVHDSSAPLAQIKGIRDGSTIARRKAPRIVRGTVGPDPAGLRAVRLSLQRKVAGRCWAYSVNRERFLRRRCGGHPAFRIGDDASWSYLLPRRLAAGRYDLRVIAVDEAGNRDRVRRGRNRVVFRVR